MRLESPAISNIETLQSKGGRPYTAVSAGKINLVINGNHTEDYPAAILCGEAC
jgi:hypothetical protein